MSIRLGAVMVLLSLVLVGCFRQAGDNFQSVDSQSSGGEQSIPTVASETPLPLPTEETTEDASLPITATDDAPPVTLIVPGDEATEDVMMLEATKTNVIPTETATFTRTPIPTEIEPQALTSPTINVPTAVPTATALGFISPEAPVQVEQATVTPITVEPESTEDVVSTNGLVTPTALPDLVDSACSYTVRAGDNLFRIALRHNTTVDALQSFNSLPSAEVIQPGQVLQIPNCVPDESEADEASPATDSGIIHVVQSGETLGAIARRYGTTINDILELNPGITNPDALSVGQEIAIPE